ncbi:MAG: hypothetical protein ACYDHT_06635 [Solirubrobacteraceae bacterium]
MRLLLAHAAGSFSLCAALRRTDRARTQLEHLPAVKRGEDGPLLVGQWELAVSVA